ncbi:hypothetical protein K438DRAFT_2156056 [Mycena galopus ATCC 62051]|nr:hypothetical protein K438DRAFT_2156056 [Mycena galopus ATCC 62051]
MKISLVAFPRQPPRGLGPSQLKGHPGLVGAELPSVSRSPEIEIICLLEYRLHSAPYCLYASTKLGSVLLAGLAAVVDSSDRPKALNESLLALDQALGPKKEIVSSDNPGDHGVAAHCSYLAPASQFKWNIKTKPVLWPSQEGILKLLQRLGHIKSTATGFVSSYKDTKSVQEYMLQNTALDSHDAEMPALFEIEQDDFRIQALCNDNATNNAAVRAFVQPPVGRESKL